ncbi:MAG: arylesterase [Xanthobacteraceae bacterium]
MVQAFALLAIIALLCGDSPAAAVKPIKIVALGDSLTAGFGLTANEAFPERLERALKAKGHAVEVVNAGVSGDTAAGGLARLDWSVPEDADGVILALGANDMLRGFDPKLTRRTLDAILRRLTERRLEVLLAGMRAMPNLGTDFGEGFEAIYKELAAKYRVVFYPFFLEGVAGDAGLNLRDGVHPSAAGVDSMVAGILPKAEELIDRIRKRPPS